MLHRLRRSCAIQLFALLISLYWLDAASDLPRIPVAIVNMVPFHHEVYPAFAHAWGRAGYDVTTFVTSGVEQQMTAVTATWGFSFRNITSFPHRFCRFKVIIFTSVEYGGDFRMASRVVRSGCKGQQSYVFVVHNPRSLRDSRRGASKLLPLVERVNVQVVGLSPHTAQAMQKILTDNGHNKTVDYIIPLFPIDTAAGGGSHRGFVLQGSISDRRRNYRDLLKGIIDAGSSWPEGFSLTVLGNGNVSIPAEAAGMLKLKPGAAYPEYYDTIQRSVGLLTAFASQIYFREKSSSTVAASLICGTPLLTESSTVKVYSYLSESSVWLRGDRENDIQAMQRILADPELETEYSKRFSSLYHDIEAAHVYNTVTVDKIMNKLLGAVPIISRGKDADKLKRARKKVIHN